MANRMPAGRARGNRIADFTRKYGESCVQQRVNIRYRSEETAVFHPLNFELTFCLHFSLG
jgi:hypothetical protein